MRAKSPPSHFQLPRVLCTMILLPFPQVFGVSFFSAKALHHNDIFLQLYWLLALVSTIALHGKDNALTMTRTAAFLPEAVGPDASALLHISQQRVELRSLHGMPHSHIPTPCT